LKRLVWNLGRANTKFKEEREKKKEKKNKWLPMAH
jgi:hypothetical protein